MPRRTRRNVEKRDQIMIWKRDKWICRYCGEPVFFNPTMKLLEELNPGHGYYDKHGDTEKDLDIFQWGMASVDHINPHSRGGTNDVKNYATACWKCNQYLNDANEEVKKCALKNGPKQKSNALLVKWDGFSGLYPKLLAISGKKDDEWSRLIKSS